MLRAAVFASVFCLLALPASALPRLGVSAAPDRYVSEISVPQGETFQVHVLVDATPLQQGFQSFNWAILQACCGGAATVLSVESADGWQNEGTCLGGMLSTWDDCAAQASYRLATLTMRMVTPESGDYFLMCGPIGLGYDCAGAGVLMTDLPLVIHYAGSVPAERSTLGSVKCRFR
jgi:hypothetical protein